MFNGYFHATSLHCEVFFKPYREYMVSKGGDDQLQYPSICPLRGVRFVTIRGRRRRDLTVLREYIIFLKVWVFLYLHFE